MTPESTSSRREQVEALVKSIIDASGKTPSSREIARRMGRSDDRTIRKDWDMLHKEGRLPERPGAQPGGGKEVARLLAETEMKLRAIIQAIGSASPEYAQNAQEYWLHHLDAISHLTEDSIKMITGEMLDGFLAEIQGGENR